MQKMTREKKRPTKKKHPGGRPLSITKDTLAKLEQAFAIGCTDVEACLYADICKDTLYRYCKKHPEFSDRKELLKDKPVLLARTNVVKALQKGDKDTSRWLLERKRRKEFSTRQEQAIDGGMDLKIEIVEHKGNKK